MIWIILVALAVIGIGLLVLKCRTSTAGIEASDEEFSIGEIATAAVELRAIRQRFNVAWTRMELSREADKLRRELAEEMRLIELLEDRIRSNG